MKLATKLILVFMIGILAIVGLFSWQTLQNQQQWERAQREDHASKLVDVLRPALVEAYREGGSIRIQQAVEVTAKHVNGAHLRWVDPEAEQRSPNDKSTPHMRITSRRVSSISVADANGDTIAYTYVPLVIDGNESGVVEVAEPLADHHKSYQRSLLTSLISLLGVASMSAIAIYWGGVRLVGKPLEKLIAQVERIGNGELRQSPALASHDELGQLAAAISHMSHRLNEQREKIRHETETRVLTQQQLRHADRLGTVGTLAAGVAHELGTPLNVVAGRAGLIASGKLSDDEVTASAHTIKSESERMTAIIRQLLDFARQGNRQTEYANVVPVVEKTCHMMQPLAEKANVRLSVDASLQEAPVQADGSQLQQVIVNLIQNAIQAMPSGGELRVTADKQAVAKAPANVTPSEHGYLCVGVHDQGVGMNEEQLEHVFEPFYTTKDVGQGTGLGLSIAYGIVREHNGWIEVDSRPGEGTDFRVFLPLAS